PVLLALKRSFEVEEVDTSAHSSPHARRTANTHLRTAISPPSQRFQDVGPRNSDYSPKLASEVANQRSPKTSLRRIELMGGRTPEPVSRRTEISIDISSKQVDSSPSPGIARFGLRRPDPQVHSKPPEAVHRRAEVSLGRPQEAPPPRRADPPSSVSRIPEPVHKKAEVPGSVDPVPRRPEAQVTKPLEAAVLSKAPENNIHATPSVPPSALLSYTEYKVPPPASEVYIRNSESKFLSTRGTSVISKTFPAKLFFSPRIHFELCDLEATLTFLEQRADKKEYKLSMFLCTGQSGLGKSTLMNTLFKSKVSRKSTLDTPEERIPKTIEIKSISHDIEEKGVRMKLTVIDTPGFGDQINNENCWQPIMKFINDQYEQYLQEEININRKKRIPDSRVHCCIYFIPPTGHCLRPLDVEFMRRLSKVVNIVPVIAKADTLTLEERDFFKKKIREDLRANGIDVYPQKEFDEDAEDRVTNERIREMIPFAVVGSDQEYQVNGRRLLGRKTKWGTIEVENIAHCEFAYLRDLLIRTHMQNIKDITSSIHYEGYRVRRLNESNTQANGVDEHDVTSHEM
ncbi:neuronal-specific septin-3-like isoform X1, partial [Arapaima gigas]